jgi:hypothetical protein
MFNNLTRKFKHKRVIGQKLVFNGLLKKQRLENQSLNFLTFCMIKQKQGPADRHGKACQLW